MVEANINAIFRRMYFDYSSSKLLLPNFTPLGWWECDVYRITPSDYFYEYEIKLSVADFRRDREKQAYDWKTKSYISKHKEIVAGNGPSRFFFIIPEEILTKIEDEIPDWAGVVVFQRHLSITKQAPILHRRKTKSTIIREARKRIVGRYWDLFLAWPDKSRIRQLEYKDEN